MLLVLYVGVDVHVQMYIYVLLKAGILFTI